MQNSCKFIDAIHAGKWGELTLHFLSHFGIKKYGKCFVVRCKMSLAFKIMQKDCLAKFHDRYCARCAYLFHLVFVKRSRLVDFFFIYQ